jgi:hypothetical protein
MKKQLNDLFFEHDAKRVDKWEQYLGTYQSELAPFVERGTPVRLLEIGVQNGGSLELWANYLPTGSVIRMEAARKPVRQQARVRFTHFNLL